eukprot:CAMPEP_0206475058 /NCGR_PEP_ID=MMETSP0324_2-20121206/33853_1 /ASSEMBLY_ACC=CAM_ASM_000836 /TAXON_ID=2866 /ORGANISM="Crypthecodinium cohnii, Strain Seligo" /LENGTH=632 /DNA_ID=CAMNT_0053950343 /DNA_START=41 /DNA_END=1939 /DNA_ORIENTATION=+
MSFVRAAAAVISGAVGYKVLDAQYNISADFKMVKRLVKVISVKKTIERKDEYTMADVWAAALAQHGNKPFVMFEGRTLTFRDMDNLSNQMAHWLLEQGFKRGDAISLVMENKPEFIAWWLAMTKIGIQIAMINYNTKQKGLVHCIKVANSVGVVFDEDTEQSLFDIEGDLPGVRLVFSSGKPSQPFKNALVASYDVLSSMPKEGEFSAMRKDLRMMSNFGFIYTSGTTGLPKAANITHAKFCQMGALIVASGIGAKDRLYTCLPIFHSAGGGIGVMGCILTGATLVLSKKFSNTRFWSDIMEYQCTAFQYIGELGRYLVNYARENPDVKKLKHKVKVAVGNGMRPEVWDEFQDGFKIELVVEFYGATEGNGALMNFCEREDLASRGAVGRMGALIGKVTNAKIVRFDVEKEEIVRGKDGFCIECPYGEAGELIFPNVQDDPTKAFKGYTDAKATEKKLLTNAFSKGDSWFRTGDLLTKDSKGYYFFVDRIGDTFRWKGENCSTMEVSEIVSAFPGVVEANVYGVKVPGSMDGRACMVAIQGPPSLQDKSNLEALQKLCQKELPPYAQPLFLRFLPAMEITGTFKHQKVNLREQGCDPSAVPDPLFWLSPHSRVYEPFGEAEYKILENGSAKL